MNYPAPIDDIDERPHGCDRFGNECECDSCQRWDARQRQFNGHTWEQIAFSAYVFLACLGLLVLIVAAYQLSLVKP